MYGSKQAGLGRYIQQLILNLEKIDTENEYVIFLRQDNINELSDTNNTNFKIVIADIPWYSWQEQTKFKKIIKREKLDLMHFPHWNVPLFYNDPFVVTIHDLIMYHYPRAEATTLGPVKFWLKDRAHRIVLRHAVKKAKKIIVTSEFTKQDVHKTLGVGLEKMVVVYQAPFGEHATRNMEHGTNEPRILERLGISKPYVLYVGNAYPHKNLERLLKAWGIFQNKYGDNYQLVLAGKGSVFYERLKSVEIVENVGSVVNGQLEQAKRFNNYNNIIFTGYVPDDELSQLYSNASLYIFPSLYEGFGLPPLEAQQYGVPVVSSSASCLPEVLGESALYFDPENVEQMSEVIHRGLIDENIRFELKTNAQENLKRFSGERLAERLAREMKKIYENSKRILLSGVDKIS